jgi:Asp-tRNA(Asn)/Glu-tRNA(Gln) amidotransferase A subunit family amidase
MIMRGLGRAFIDFGLGMNDLALLSINRLSGMLDTAEISAESLTRLFLDRAEGVGRRLNCYITLCKETALQEARTATARAAAKRRRSALDGIPIALKDNIDVAGVPTSNGFGGAPWRIPTEDAEIVRRLREAGAVILGKLNMHEGALGATNDNPHHGRAFNPHRAGHSPGGSSGGSGAAVAAGLCCAALGTDTGGSVRIPASWCGVIGLKPSYGLISTRGVVPLSYRLDHAGPLTRTVADAAIMLGVLGGFDPGCPESRRGPNVSYHTLKPGRLDNVRLGVIDNFAAEPTEPAINAAFNVALEQLADLGAEIRTVNLPSYDMVQGRRAGFLRVEAEAAFVHGPLYGKEPDRFSLEMHRYLSYGARMPATQLLAADRRIDIAAFELAHCFEEVDAIVSPTTPQAALLFGGSEPDSAGAFSILANFAGYPAISAPMGRNEMGLPLGLQIIGAHHGDVRMLEIAACYEAAAGLDIRPPPLGGIKV